MYISLWDPIKFIPEYWDGSTGLAATLLGEWLGNYIRQFEKSQLTGEVPGDWKKGNIVPVFKRRVERRILGTSNLSAPSL